MRLFFLTTVVWFCMAVCGIATPPSAEDFGTLPFTFDASISPDGNKIAVIENNNNSGEYIVNIVDVIDGKKTPGPVLVRTVHPQWVKWANDKRLLIGVKQNMVRHKVPIVYTFIITVGLGALDQPQILVDSMANSRQFNANVIDFLESDPDHILMSVRPKAKKRGGISRNPEVRLVKVDSGKYATIQKNKPGILNWTVDRRRQPRVGAGYTVKSQDKEDIQPLMLIRDSDGDTWRDVSAYPGLKADTPIFGFTKNPNEMVVGQYRDFDTLGLYIYNLEAKNFTRKLFHNEKYDASGLIYDAAGNDVIGAKYVSDDDVQVLFGPNDNSTDSVSRKYPGMMVDYVDSSKSGKFIYRISGPSTPGFYILLNTNTGAVEWESDYLPRLPASKMGSVHNITYKTRDGIDLPAYITLPPSVNEAAMKNLPFIVLPHGGPSARDSKRFDYFAQFYATRGFGVLQMNFRGSTGYGKSFRDAGQKNWIVMQEDVEDGTRWLINQGYADPERVCIAGWSYGGYAALMGAIRSPDLYQCAISVAGVTDLKDLVRDLKKYEFGRAAAKQGILGGFESRDNLDENSPVKRAEEIAIPVLLVHGRNDQRVHFDQFKRMEKALKKSKARVTALPLNGEDHFISDQYNRDKFFEQLDQFLKAAVGPSEYAR